MTPPLDFRLLFESGSGLNLVLTPDLKIVAVSDAYLRATMTERAAILGRSLFEVFPDNPEDSGATGENNLRASLAKVLRTKQPDVMALQKYDIRRPEAEGGGFEERHWSPVNSPAIGGDGEVAYIIHRVEDVTEFVRLRQSGNTRAEQMEAEVYLRSQEVAEANRQLKAANEQLAGLYDGIAHLMAQADAELRLGTEPESASGPTQDPGTPEDMLARVERLLEGHRRLEEELRQAQKMEAVGRLAGGIAHDFNNELTVIIGCSELILNRLQPQDPMHPRLQEVLRAGERAGALTKQLLAFSRKQVLQPKVVSLAATLREMDSMLRRVLGEDIEIATAIDGDVAQVKIDPSQVQQVIVNLVVNARDAMPKGGKLTLELRNVDVNESYGRKHVVPSGRYVMLAVSDSGIGMDAATQQRVFEPFFTTKPVGKGTGLGLATVYGIVRQSGGHIWLYSELGAGTTFKIFLPRVDEKPEAVVSEARLEMARANSTILVVEDSESIRALLEEILGFAGYNVTVCADGEAAIKASREHAGGIDLLITDIVLPKMSGKEIAERLTASRPSMKVLFISGYTGDAIIHHGILTESKINFLQKPFTAAALTAKVRQIIDSPTASMPIASDGKPATERPRRRILVIDDEAPVRELIVSMLEPLGCEVYSAASGQEARVRIQSQPVDVVITDLVMPEEEGIEIIRHFHKSFPSLKIVAMSGAFGPEVLEAASLLGAHATLTKPLTMEKVRRCIEGL